MIPARYHSTRLPGKPLELIGGLPMIQWVVMRAKKASMISRVLVATDNEQIRRCVEQFGCDAVMTPPELPSGTDRVAYAVRSMDADVIINLQGDEPFIESDEIDSLARMMAGDLSVQMGTLVRKTDLEDGFHDSNSVKVVVDRYHYALYFSRSPVPFPRDGKGPAAYYKHIGVYGFRKSFLMQYVKWPPSHLELCEKLEQLRVLENGGRIKVLETKFRHLCVDTPEDLENARRRAETIQNRL